MANQLNNLELITEIEEIKKTLTEAQKGLEDRDYQIAGDCATGAQMRLKPVVHRILDIFNQSQ